ncbi:hypothetical protein BC332_01169 [Capsicum chinense]|nr:hypothetical protein BC332_01169 [Capsicum chinense]
MGKKNIHSKTKDGTGSYSAGSSRKRKIEVVENVIKRNKIDKEVFESDLELKEISDYAESSEDVLPERSVSGDSEESEGSGRNSDDGDNDPLSVLYLSRFIFVEQHDLRTIMDEVGSFPVKILARSRMDAYREFKQVLVDQELKKRFNWSCFGHLRNLPKYLKFNGRWSIICCCEASKAIRCVMRCEDSTKIVDIKLIRMVDSLSFFKNYPWGKEIFQLILDYMKKKSDLKKQREVFDEKKKASYALFRFSWTFMVWIYEVFPHLGKFAEKSTDEPFPIPHILRWHTTKSDQIIEGGLFKYKGKVTEDSDDDGDLGGNPVGVRIGNDDTPSTSKDIAGTSSSGDLHKRVAALKEAALDISTYIREKRLKKKKG